MGRAYLDTCNAQVDDMVREERLMAEAARRSLEFREEH